MKQQNQLPHLRQTEKSDMSRLDYGYKSQVSASEFVFTLILTSDRISTSETYGLIFIGAKVNDTAGSLQKY